MNCRKGCAACCIVVSINSPLPGMPEGKPAGVRCVNLTEENACRIYGTDEYPAFCRGLKPNREMCGATHAEAFTYLARLEAATRPPGVLRTEARQCPTDRSISAGAPRR